MTDRSKGGRSGAYLRVRRWVDAQWAAPGQQHKVLLLPALLPAALFIPLMEDAGWLLWLCIGWAVFWLGGIGWRGVRMLRANAKKQDRIYDRKTKFELAPEYWTTESATQTRRKKREKSARADAVNRR